MHKTLGELASLVGGELCGEPQQKISGVASLEEATERDISFLLGAKYLKQAEHSGAGALIVPPAFKKLDRPLIVSDNPYLAFAKVLELFTREQTVPLGVSPTARIGDNVQLGEDISVHPHVYVGENAVLGNRVTLHAGVYVGDHVHIGDDTLIHPNVTILQRCIIGKRVIIHSGTVVGSDGFGFAQNGEQHFKIPQVGVVQIDDDVEIGANCSIDRATLGRTWIQRGVKIDNLVQVAHNVTIGEDTIIIAQVGIAGSTRIGKSVILAGQVGVAGHVEIGDGARVGAQSGIAKSVPPGETVSGSPAVDHRVWLKNCHIISKLPELHKKIRDLGKRLAILEQGKES
jgi:UDP-3-O-[3-hydroxymyristoyl] glucosamine N-acyltransferase